MRPQRQLRWYLRTLHGSLGLVLLLAHVWAGVTSAQAGHTALVLTLEGPLTPPMTSYLERGLSQAQSIGAELIILKLDTPGGSILLMKELIEQIRNSPTPVVVFVTPRGAWAGSAGTLITLAGHVAAMSPETTIGAASPVGGGGEDLGETLEAKAKEETMALARTLAAHRPPAAIALAEATIESAQAVTADEALEVGLVDFMAEDIPSLLRQLEGFTVTVSGQPRTLSTTGLSLTEQNWNLVETILHVLASNTELMFLLLSAGGWLLWIEISQPGGWVSGFLGVVCIALALYSIGTLPVNWFGIVFIVLAFILFILEIQTPTYGGLTVAAVASLAVGALVLFNSPGSLPYTQISVPFVIAVSVVIGALSFGLVVVVLRTRNRPLTLGVETLIGKEGEVRSANSVQVAGELWSAEAEDGNLEPGQNVVVTEVRGLKVRVKRKA